MRHWFNRHKNLQNTTQPLGWWRRFRQWLKKWLWRSFLAMVLSVMLFCTPVFSWLGLKLLDTMPLPSQAVGNNTPATAIVVLGGGLWRDANNNIIINPYTLNRLKTAKQLYLKNQLPIVLSGVESPWMKKWLTEQNITTVVMERGSKNTCENAKFTAKQLPLSHVFLITDAYHMQRARRQFALNNIATTPVSAELAHPTHWLHPSKNINHSRRTLYEIIAILRDMMSPETSC